MCLTSFGEATLEVLLTCNVQKSMLTLVILVDDSTTTHLNYF